MAAGQQPTALAVAGLLARTIGGGVLCGTGMALGALLMTGRTEDHLVEITFTDVAAYGSFLSAERFGMSGVLATITAGLVMGNFKRSGTISEQGKVAVQAFWEYAAFAANSLVFLLIGMHEAHQNFMAIWVSALIAILLVTLGRAVAIYPCCLLFTHSAQRGPGRAPARLFLGRIAGRAGPGPGAGIAPGRTATRADHHRYVRGGGILGVRSGINGHAVSPENGGTAGA